MDVQYRNASRFVTNLFSLIRVMHRSECAATASKLSTGCVIGQFRVHFSDSSIRGSKRVSSSIIRRYDGVMSVLFAMALLSSMTNCVADRIACCDLMNHGHAFALLEMSKVLRRGSDLAIGFECWEFGTKARHKDFEAWLLLRVSKWAGPCQDRSFLPCC